MTTADPTAVPRLNPFVFLSDTRFRFALLIAAVLGPSLFVYNWIALELRDQRTFLELVDTCFAKVAASGIPTGRADVDGTGQIERFKILTACLAPAERATGRLTLIGLAVLVTLAFACYLALPWWQARRRRLVRLLRDDAPQPWARVDALSREAGLARTPELWWNPADSGSRALAFGGPRRRRVAIGAGLLTRYYTDELAFCAVLRHEIAHLANRDVTQTYLTVACWYTFLVAAVLPMLLTLGDEPLPVVFGLAWRLAALAVLIYLSRNAVLRARELHADARAAQYGESRTVLRGLFAGEGPPRAAAWRRWLSAHPDPGLRRQTLDDPQRLFRTGFWDSLATGLITGLAIPGVANVILLFLVGTDRAVYGQPLAALLVATPLGAALGAALWRWTFATLVLNGKRPRAFAIMVGLGIGLVVGEFLALDAAVLGEPSEQSLSALTVLSTVVILLGTLLLVGWATAVTDSWLEVIARSGTRRVNQVVVALVAVMFGLAFGGLLLFDELMEAAAQGLTAPVIDPTNEFAVVNVVVGRFVTNPLATLLLMSLVTFPMVGAAVARRMEDREPLVPPWAVLTGGAGNRQWPRLGPWRPRVALWWGLAGGIVIALLRIFHVNLSSPVLLALLSREELAPLFNYYMVDVLFILGAETCVALVVAATCRRAPVVHGLFAAMLCAVVSVVSTIALDTKLPWKTSAENLSYFTGFALTGGTFVALLASLVGCTFGGATRAVGGVRRARQHSRTQA